MHFGLVEAVWIVCVLPVDFWWPVNTSLEMEVLEAQADAVVGVVRLLPSGLASGPLRLRDSVPPTHVKLLRTPIHCNTFYARDRAREIKLTTNWVRDSPK